MATGQQKYFPDVQVYDSPVANSQQQPTTVHKISNQNFTSPEDENVPKTFVYN